MNTFNPEIDYTKSSENVSMDSIKNPTEILKRIITIQNLYQEIISSNKVLSPDANTESSLIQDDQENNLLTGVKHNIYDEIF